MSCRWKEEAGAPVINWNTGWTTKISKDDSKYTKTAFKKGEAKPANSSAGEKIRSSSG